MANLLISFCNVFPPGLALGVYDFDRRRFKWIDFSDIGERIAGVTGLCQYGGEYCCLVQLPAQSSALVTLGKNLEVRRVYRLTETRDAHSLTSFGGGLLVTDTSRNRLVSIQPSGDGEPGEVQYWRYCDDATDAVHLNSVAHVSGRVFVSLFGPRPEAGWRSAQRGMVIDISANRIVCDNLLHPHTLVNVDGTLYWLESNTGLVHRFADGRGHEVVAKLEGYLRGMTYDGRYLYVAASAMRRRSRSTGTTNQPGPLTPLTANSWIYRVNRESLEVEKRTLTALGAEIYDLLLLERDDIGFCDEVDPIVQRMWAWEDEYAGAVSKLERSLAEASERLEAAIRDKGDTVARLERSLYEANALFEATIRGKDELIAELERSLRQKDLALAEKDDTIAKLRRVAPVTLYLGLVSFLTRAHKDG